MLNLFLPTLSVIFICSSTPSFEPKVYNRISSGLVSLDIEKVLNRLNHDACIRSLIEHGASKLSVDMIHAKLLAVT